LTKSLSCNDAFYQEFSIFRVFIFREMFLEDCAQIPSQRNRIPCIRLDDVIFRLAARLSKHHSSGRLELFVWTFLCVENLRSISVFDRLKDFFPKHRYGKTVATVRTMCVPVWMLSLIRQVVHTKFNRLDVRFHGPDALISFMEIACISPTIQTSDFMIRMLISLIWKLHIGKVQPSER